MPKGRGFHGEYLMKIDKGAEIKDILIMTWESREDNEVFNVEIARALNDGFIVEGIAAKDDSVGILLYRNRKEAY